MNKLLAQAPVTFSVTKPAFLVTDLGSILSWAIRIVLIMAAFFVFYHMLRGALDWIQSGGDKEKVEKARKEMTTAVVGLLVMFVTFALIVLIEQVFGIGLGLSLPISIPRFGTTGGI